MVYFILRYTNIWRSSMVKSLIEFLHRRSTLVYCILLLHQSSLLLFRRSNLVFIGVGWILVHIISGWFVADVKSLAQWNWPKVSPKVVWTTQTTYSQIGPNGNRWDIKDDSKLAAALTGNTSSFQAASEAIRYWEIVGQRKMFQTVQLVQILAKEMGWMRQVLEHYQYTTTILLRNTIQGLIKCCEPSVSSQNNITLIFLFYSESILFQNLNDEKSIVSAEGTSFIFKDVKIFKSLEDG